MAAMGLCTVDLLFLTLHTLRGRQAVQFSITTGAGAIDQKGLESRTLLCGNLNSFIGFYKRTESVLFVLQISV